ncbi:hypothetical protein AB0I60_00425 [Actinosynnema sp. NPDC050436]|uniref:hypothetical protein n=1 Tax=Actinosynnema sp. NPDC050436 TaxID=3155659 RepID=UPI0033E246DC
MKTLWTAVVGVLALALPSPTAHAEPTHGGQGPDPAAVDRVVAGAEPISRSEVITRARTWLTPPVPYSMEQWYQGWRTDCSGYVSMAWRLDSSLTTVSLPSIAHRIEKQELRAGDVMMNGGPDSGGANGHVVIFERWVDDSHNAYWAYEQTPPQTVHHQVPYPYSGHDTKFVPYRYNLIEEDTLPQTPDR